MVEKLMMLPLHIHHVVQISLFFNLSFLSCHHIHMVGMLFRSTRICQVDNMVMVLALDLELDLVEVVRIRSLGQVSFRRHQG